MSRKNKAVVFTVHNKIQLLKGGTEYFSKLHELIDGAKESIHIRIYIWEPDKTGTQLADALIAASMRKVAVFVMADGYASQGLTRAFRTRLKQAGIHFHFFEPLLRSSKFYFGRRMHEKIVVVDGIHALVGGVNLADRYNDVDGIPAWLDYALYLQGEAAYELHRYCSTSWINQLPVKPPPDVTSYERCSVRIRRNDWVKGKHEVWRSYFNRFNEATESITIMCSYFLPGRVLRNRLIRAARRGVRVRIILAGPSDVMLAKHAERYLYPEMLKNSIGIYEYQPTVLHAKMMVVDNHWVTIGSYNVNNVSAYASIELNLDVRNKSFARSVQLPMNRIIEADCVEVTEKNFATNATIFRRFIQRCSYELIRVVLNLSTFYFRHE